MIGAFTLGFALGCVLVELTVGRSLRIQLSQRTVELWLAREREKAGKK